MTTKHLVDPQLAPMLDVLPTVEYSLEKLPLIREQFKSIEALMPPLAPNGVEITERFIPGPKSEPGAPDVRVVIYTPPGNDRLRPALLHTHGGGYVVASPESFRARYQSLSADLGCVVVSVDYRSPPEHPHPAPIEDCYVGLKWLYDHAAELGVNRAKIAIAGESAGGGLAAALALLARDRNEVPVVYQLLIYPMLDDRISSTREPYVNTGEFLWTAAANRFGWGALLGKPPGGDNVSCYASAMRAQDLKGLPPAFISVGTLDLFLREDVEYAQRLLDAGVTTELHVYPGAFHGFEMVADASVSQQFERDVRHALRKALA